MKAGDEVRPGNLTFGEFTERLYNLLTDRQREWLDNVKVSPAIAKWGVMQKLGVPSDAELQRREKRED